MSQAPIRDRSHGLYYLCSQTHYFHYLISNDNCNCVAKNIQIVNRWKVCQFVQVCGEPVFDLPWCWQPHLYGQHNNLQKDMMMVQNY